jgi:hypothetical protein
MATCGVVLAARGAWVGAAFVGLLWLGYVLFVRVGRCGVGRGPGSPCDEPVSGLLGTCHLHRGDKSRYRPRIARSGAVGVRVWWPRTAARVGAGAPVDRPRPPASAPRRRLMDALGGVGLVVAAMSLVGDLLSR